MDVSSWPISTLQQIAQTRPVKIALYGGSFNPIHLGHLETAYCVAKELELDALCFMPNAVPPHKQGCLPFTTRYHLLNLALKELSILKYVQEHKFCLSNLDSILPHISAIEANTHIAYHKHDAEDLSSPLEFSLLPCDIEKDESQKHFTFNTLLAFKQAMHHLLCSNTTTLENTQDSATSTSNSNEYCPIQLYFIMGMDSFLNLDTWFRGLELSTISHIVVLQRPSFELNFSLLKPSLKEALANTTVHINLLEKNLSNFNGLQNITLTKDLCSNQLNINYNAHYIFLKNPEFAISSTQIRSLLAQHYNSLVNTSQELKDLSACLNNHEKLIHSNPADEFLSLQQKIDLFRYLHYNTTLLPKDFITLEFLNELSKSTSLQKLASLLPLSCCAYILQEQLFCSYNS